ncbi:hypothetical protein [Geminicoccus flavidas]|uniref:hypothetical protein n=1 Tax=Geminicoccus flavidas TaxID=2506407 RepID=UPI00135A8031|nr:hypothetical protein [Geminicoccus flavidas]
MTYPAYAAVDLDNVEIRNQGRRYNMTVIREQTRTSSFKAQQYAEYLAKHKFTDEYVVAYAKALAAKFGTPMPSESAASPRPQACAACPAPAPAPAPAPTPPPASTPNPPDKPAFVQAPILNGIEVSNLGWRYNLTVIKKFGEYSAERQATSEYWRDRNRVTDANVHAYAAAVA